MDVKLTKRNDPDLNTTFDIRHIPMKLSKYENAFKEFVRRGKETLFDHYYNVLEDNMNINLDILDYLKNVNASTEDKFETVIKDIVTEKEIENYLYQCWRYNFVNWQSGAMENKEACDNSVSISLYFKLCTNFTYTIHFVEFLKPLHTASLLRAVEAR